jgi:hypothetical protein
MNAMNKIIKTVTLIQIAITLLSLTVAAMGAVIENVYLAYFWFLGLAGIATVIMTSVTAGVVLLAGRIIRWYRRQLQNWDGYPAGV